MTDEPTRVELETPDLAAKKRELVEELLPGVVVDGVVDAARLGELLDLPVTAPSDGRERFGLMWAGKQEAVRSLLRASKATLVPDVEASSDFDNAQHVFIEGDNLEVLKLLQKAYNDKVKLIYIDPPYNTGSNDFIYPDNFSDPLKAYLEFTGEMDSDGKRTSAGAETTGRRHSRWLSMMYPRLVLARNLLTQDGVIFVSIDDNEVAHLRALMDEVFGQENFIASVIWHKVHTLKNTARYFSDDHDYVVVYARNAETWDPGLLPRTAEQDERFSNPDSDPRGPWISGPIQARNYYSRGTYSITTPSGRVIDGPPSGSYWRYSIEAFRELDADNRIYWGATGANVPRVKRFLSEMKEGRVPQTIWPHSEVGHNQGAKQELLDRVEFESSDSVFDTPKPTRLIRRMLSIATKSETNDVVLDFFAGSGSTADAVLQQNADDGGNRRSISVQLPQPTGHSDFELVSDITIARIRSAMDNLGVDGLRVHRLARSNFVQDEIDDGALDFNASTLRVEDADVWSVAAEVFLKEGVALDEPWTEHEFDNVVVEVAGDVAVVVGTQLSDATLEAIFELEPRVIVLLEDDLAGKDALKANAVTNARNLGITLKTV